MCVYTKPYSKLGCRADLNIIRRVIISAIGGRVLLKFDTRGSNNKTEFGQSIVFDI